MSFGQNLQFLRKMYHGMTQEELAERMGVSRQTISKWELDNSYPEMEKVIELCELFSCSIDKLIREDINFSNDSFSNIRVEDVEAFEYVQYVVISREPEDDAIAYIKKWASKLKLEDPQIIGWDFPNVSQEQINVFHMHGYAAACIIPQGLNLSGNSLDIFGQKKEKYIAITIREPFSSPFTLIPNAYKALMFYMEINGIKHKQSKNTISCFEKEYIKDNTQYMDVYIAVTM